MPRPTLTPRIIPAGDQQVILRFMESTIKKVNSCLANIFAIKMLLIERGIVSESDLADKIKEAEKFPERLVGIKSLEEMLKSYKKGELRG